MSTLQTMIQKRKISCISSVDAYSDSLDNSIFNSTGLERGFCKKKCKEAFVQTSYISFSFKRHLSITQEEYSFTSIYRPVQKHKERVSIKHVAHNPYNIVLDLDQTLISVCKEQSLKYIEFEKNGSTLRYYIHIRPYATDFIKNISKYFNIIIYSNSYIKYAHKVVELLDPSHTYIRRENVIARDHSAHESSQKDLSAYNKFTSQNDSFVIVDDNMNIWNDKYWSNIIISQKYYPTIKEQGLLENCPRGSNQRYNPFVQLTRSNQKPYIETNDSKTQQLFNIEKFLIKSIYLHKLTPQFNFLTVVNNSKKVLCNKAFCIIPSNLPNESEEFIIALKSIAEQMGGRVNVETSTENITYIYSNRECNQQEPTPNAGCLVYTYITDCLFHLQQMEERNYRVSFCK